MHTFGTLFTSERFEVTTNNVLYRNVVLLKPLGNYPQGHRFEVVAFKPELGAIKTKVPLAERPNDHIWLTFNITGAELPAWQKDLAKPV